MHPCLKRGHQWRDVALAHCLNGQRHVMHLGQLEQFAPASEVIDDRSLPRAPSVVMSSFQFFTAANCYDCAVVETFFKIIRA
jgi:hypothetical protein